MLCLLHHLTARICQQGRVSCCRLIMAKFLPVNWSYLVELSQLFWNVLIISVDSCGPLDRMLFTSTLSQTNKDPFHKQQE